MTRKHFTAIAASLAQARKEAAAGLATSGVIDRLECEWRHLFAKDNPNFSSHKFHETSK